MTALANARISSDIADAASILRRALGLKPMVGSDLLPSQAEWRMMDDAARMLAIGEWLKSVCYEQADITAAAPPVAWEPIGGQKYANQND